jgi:3-methyl-2-oxobutanoate hydroxymethyltransferase
MITIPRLLEKKRCKEKIVMLTAYDYPLARLVEKSGVDMILIGDSGGMVALGYRDTIPVTMDEMLTMVRAVRRGAPDTFLIADLPFLSYQVSAEQAIMNAGRLVKEGGADAVKLEGGRRMAATVRALTDAGIVVQGHIGLTPQNVTQLGGYRVQGAAPESARRLIDDAIALAEAGIFSLILETVPVRVADFITDNLGILTIGTGSGSGCDGQNLITPDLLTYYDESFSPRYIKRYANISEVIGAALRQYGEEVRAGAFPAADHTYPLKDDGFLDIVFAEVEKAEAEKADADR